MSSHSAAKAKERFPEFAGLASPGAPVVITRDGRPVAELRPVGRGRPRSGAPARPA